MAERLRLSSGAEVARKFQRTGWTVARQLGSHDCQNRF
jgi:predicted RNA binding protein YcfA (HicA-like mRNA interferase family)